MDPQVVLSLYGQGFYLIVLIVWCCDGVQFNRKVLNC